MPEVLTYRLTGGWKRDWKVTADKWRDSECEICAGQRATTKIPFTWKSHKWIKKIGQIYTVKDESSIKKGEIMPFGAT